MKLPESGTLEVVVGLYCPARCPFCVNVQKNDFPEGDTETFLSQLRKMLLAAETAGTRLRVGITGGEPTDSKYLRRTLAALDIIQQFDDVVELSYLITHGGNLLKVVEGKTIVQHLASAGLDFVNISYHATTITKNQAILGIPIPAPEQLVAAVYATGMGLRWHCVLRQDGVRTIEDVMQYIGQRHQFHPEASYNFKELYDFAGNAAGVAHGFESLPMIERQPALDRKRNFVSVYDLAQAALDRGFTMTHQNNFGLRDCTQMFMRYGEIEPIVFSSLTVGDEEETTDQSAYWVLHPDGLVTTSWNREKVLEL